MHLQCDVNTIYDESISVNALSTKTLWGASQIKLSIRNNYIHRGFACPMGEILKNMKNSAHLINHSILIYGKKTKSYLFFSVEYFDTFML